MIPLSAQQQSLALRVGQAPVGLFRLTFYTDVSNVDPGKWALDETFHFSQFQPAYYQVAGTDTWFDPWVIDSTALGASIPRIPEPGQVFQRQALSIRLRNEDVPGRGSLWSILRTKNWQGAQLEAWELLIDPALKVRGTAGAYWDLRSIPADDYTVRFTGFVDVPQLEDDGAEILIEASQVEPQVPWIELLDLTENDPEDFGQRLPVVVGAAERVPALGIKVGWATALAASLSSSYTGPIDSTDPSGFPTSGTFQAFLYGEEVTLSFDGTVLSIVTRGTNGTIATNHAAGATIVELGSEVVLGVAGHPIQGVDALYVEHPLTNQLVKLSAFTVIENDTLAIPGRTVATARIDQTGLRDLFRDVFVSAQVTQQAQYDAPASGGDTITVEVTPSNVTKVTDLLVDTADWTIPSPTVPNPARMSQSTAQQRLRGTFQSGDMGGNGSKPVIQWRMFNRFTSLSGHGNADMYQTSSGVAQGPPQLFRFLPGANVAFPKAFGPTQSVSGGQTLDSLVGAILDIYSPNNDTPSIDVVEWGIEAVLQNTPPSGGGPTTITQDAEIAAASVGFGARFYADVRGAEVPGVFVSGYAFDDATGWNVDRCTHTGGAQEQQLDYASILFENGDCESAAAWIGGLSTLTDDSGWFTEGTQSIRATSTSDAVGFFNANRVLSSAIDVQGFFCAVDLRPKDIPVSANAMVRMNLISSGSDFKTWDIGTDSGVADDTPIALVIDPENDPESTSGGSLNLAAVNRIAAGAAIAPTAGEFFRMDNFRRLAREVFLQKNDVASVDLTSVENRYQITLEASGVAGIESVTVYFSNVAGVGAAPPADRWEAVIGGGSLPEGVSTSVVASVVAVGSPPSPSAVQTIGVRVTTNRPGIGASAVQVKIQELEISQATNPNYGKAVGTLIETPGDVARWFLADFMGFGHGAVGASFGATDFGSMVLAGNLAGAGERLDEVLGRLGYESRGTIFQRETQVAPVYEIVAASSAYKYTDPSGELGSLISGLERLPQVPAELASRFQAMYGYDASVQGGTEASFTLVATAQKDANDTPVPVADLEAAERAYGILAAPLAFYLLVRDPATAGELLGHFATYGTRPQAAIIEADFHSWDVYAVEVGDTFTVAAPWDAASRKMLVTSVARAIGAPVARLELAEVL